MAESSIIQLFSRILINSKVNFSYNVFFRSKKYITFARSIYLK